MLNMFLIIIKSKLPVCVNIFLFCFPREQGRIINHDLSALLFPTYHVDAVQLLRAEVGDQR